jgi:hypothetical protein
MSSYQIYELSNFSTREVITYQWACEQSKDGSLSVDHLAGIEGALNILNDSPKTRLEIKDGKLIGVMMTPPDHILGRTFILTTPRSAEVVFWTNETDGFIAMFAEDAKSVWKRILWRNGGYFSMGNMDHSDGFDLSLFMLVGIVINTIIEHEQGAGH